MSEKEVEKTTETPTQPWPDVDPDRRLNPDRLCPGQKDDLAKIVKGI